MIAIEQDRQAQTAAQPKCVAHLLATLQSMSGALAEGRASGPYALDALLDDVLLCPAIDKKPGPVGDKPAAVIDAVAQARNAAKVLRSCPGRDRQWAVNRLSEAVALARSQLAARVAEANATGNPEGLFSDRCGDCVFAGR